MSIWIVLIAIGTGWLAILSVVWAICELAAEAERDAIHERELGESLERLWELGPTGKFWPVEAPEG